MKIPKINITFNYDRTGLEINPGYGSYGVSSILSCIRDKLDAYIGFSASDYTRELVQGEVDRFLYALVEANYVFLGHKNEWRINRVEFVSNRLGYTCRHGKLREAPCIPMPWLTPDHKVLTSYLVDFNNNFYPQVKMQPAEIIEWFVEKLDQPELYLAVDKIRNEKIIELAKI